MRPAGQPGGSCPVWPGPRRQTVCVPFRAYRFPAAGSDSRLKRDCKKIGESAMKRLALLTLVAALAIAAVPAGGSRAAAAREGRGDGDGRGGGGVAAPVAEAP